MEGSWVALIGAEGVNWPSAASSMAQIFFDFG
jgi:hypothetical protein